MKVKKVLTSIATTTMFQRVGSMDPVIGDFLAATRLAPIQGLRRSSGTPPMAPIRRLSQDLEGPPTALICFFLLVLDLSIGTMVLKKHFSWSS
jgi:hypothetical protein